MSEDYVDIITASSNFIKWPPQKTVTLANVVKLSQLEKWSENVHMTRMCHDTIYETALYPVNQDLNDKILICDPRQYPFLEVDVIVFRAPDTFEISQNVVKEAGSKFAHQLTEKQVLRTGEVFPICDHNLVGASQIVCVAGIEGPLSSNFSNSLDSLVTKTYKNLMMAVLSLEELNATESIAICGLYPTKDSIYDGIHSALRVLRKVLEHREFSELKSVVLCPTESEAPELLEILSHYFPRNKNEEQLAFFDARMNYNEWGELIKEENIVEVVKRPGRPVDFNSIAYEISPDGHDNEQSLKDLIGGTDSSDNHMNSKNKSSKPKELKRLGREYNRLLIEAKRHNYSGLLQKFLFFCGPNKLGDQTIIVIGQNLPTGNATLLHEAFLYFIDFMDHLVNRRYMIIFFCSRHRNGSMSVEACQNMFFSLDERYLRNLVNLFVVHSNLMDRIWTWAVTTFRLNGVKDKIKFVNSLLSLDELIDVSTLNLPSTIYELETVVHT